MANPRTIKPNTSEFEKLEAAAAMLEAFSPNGAWYTVENVYFDYGQDWMWTTICRSRYRECQVLSPRDWELIITAETPAELAEAVEVVRNDKYFNDKEPEEAHEAEYEIMTAGVKKELAEYEATKNRHGEYADAFERACAEIQAENEARNAERLANK